MVLAGDHRDDRLAVGKGKDRDFRTGQVLFHDNPLAGVAELPFRHHRMDGLDRFFLILGDDNPFAEGEAVGLDDGGVLVLGADIVLGRLLVGEGLIPGGRDAVLLHQVFGEDLACLDDRRFRAGAKGGDAGFFKGVGHPSSQRVVGGDDGEVDPLFLREGDHPLFVHDVHRGGVGDGRDTAVAGGAPEFLHPRGLEEF